MVCNTIQTELFKGNLITKGKVTEIRSGRSWKGSGRGKMRADLSLEGILSTVPYVAFSVWQHLSGPEKQQLNTVHPYNVILVALLSILVSWLVCTHSVSYDSIGQGSRSRDLQKELSWCKVCVLPFVLPKSKWRQDVRVQHLRFPCLLKWVWKDYCEGLGSDILLFVSNLKKENTLSPNNKNMKRRIRMKENRATFGRRAKGCTWCY